MAVQVAEGVDVTRYDEGRRFEWAVRDEMVRAGFVVIRSAGSKTPVDIVGLKRNLLLFVQCKKTGQLPPAERQALVGLAAQLDQAWPVVAYKVSGVAAPKFQLVTGVGPRDRQDWTLEGYADQAAPT